MDELLAIPPRRFHELPLFPLPRAHLFPHAMLPLYVFEQRYRDLVKDCLASGDRALGIPTLQPGYEPEYAGRPTLRPVMGAGVIVAAKERDDGTWDIVVRGTDRVRVVSEHPPHARYRTAHVQRLPERPAPPDDPLYARMRNLLGQLATRAPEAAEPLSLMLNNAESPAELTDLVAAHAISDEDLRRLMLETADVRERLRLGCEHLGRLLLDVCERADAPLH